MTRPRTGDKRRTKQPLKIDRLPQSMRDRILFERNTCGRSWDEIELDSPKFDEWKDVPADVAALFPGKRLPHTNLHRWYDLRVDQVVKETLAEGERAREIAATFAGRAFDELSESVKNALAEQVFMLTRSAGEKDVKTFRKELGGLLFLLTKLQKAELDKAKLQVEQQKLADRKEREAAFDPREMYLEAAQDVLKKLRTRKPVREVIDPLQEELIAEFAHGAEAFAKQVEARQA